VPSIRSKVKFVLFGVELEHKFLSLEQERFFLKSLKQFDLNRTPPLLTASFSRYLKYETLNKSSSSQNSDKLVIKRFLHFCKVRELLLLSEITYFDIKDFQKHLLTLMSETSVNRSFNTLNHCFKKFIDWGFMSKSPASVTRLRDNDVYINLWTARDYLYVINCLNRKDQLVMGIMWNTGARLQSIIDLKKEDINLKRGTIRFKSNKGTGGAPKYYTVPLNSKLMYMLKTDQYLVPFKNSLKNLYTSQYFQKKFNKIDYVIEHGLKLHHVRHTFATNLFEKGLDIESISQLLGHSSSIITRRYFGDNIVALQKRLKKIS